MVVGEIGDKIRWSIPEDELKAHLDFYYPILTDEDQEKYKNFDNKSKYRWITSIKRIDWNKYFKLHNYVHDLAFLASYEPRTNPVGFLRPDYVYFNTLGYKPECPSMLKSEACNFYKLACNRDYNNLKTCYEFIELLCF